VLSGATLPGAALKAISMPGSGSTRAKPPASGCPDLANRLARAHRARRRCLQVEPAERPGVVGEADRLDRYVDIRAIFASTARSNSRLQVAAHSRRDRRRRRCSARNFEPFPENPATPAAVNPGRGRVRRRRRSRRPGASARSGRVIGGRIEWARRVGGVADHERDALFPARHPGRRAARVRPARPAPRCKRERVRMKSSFE